MICEFVLCTVSPTRETSVPCVGKRRRAQHNFSRKPKTYAEAKHCRNNNMPIQARSYARVIIPHVNSKEMNHSLSSARSVVSETSCSSTISTMAQEVKQAPSFSSRRSVRFCEDDNEYYTNTQMREEEIHELWFSSDELQIFKSSTACLARKVLRSNSEDTQAWVQSLLNAYQDLAEASTVDDLQDILENSTDLPSISCNLWGLEKWILRPVVHEKMARRAYMLHIIRECQENTTSSQASKNKLLRKASREVSRPSRLFAHHVAMMAYNS